MAKNRNQCFENGKITTEDTGGIELTFGNAEAMVKMTEMIAKGEGFGNILALGSAAAAEEIPQEDRKRLDRVAHRVGRRQLVSVSVFAARCD